MSMYSARSKEENQALLAQLAEVAGVEVLIKLAQNLATSRRAHPVFAHGLEHAVKVCRSEMLEWESQAMLCVEPNGTVNEARLKKCTNEGYHVVATLVRMLNREYEEKPQSVFAEGYILDKFLEECCVNNSSIQHMYQGGIATLSSLHRTFLWWAEKQGFPSIGLSSFETGLKTKGYIIYQGPGDLLVRVSIQSWVPTFVPGNQNQESRGKPTVICEMDGPAGQ